MRFMMLIQGKEEKTKEKTKEKVDIISLPANCCHPPGVRKISEKRSHVRNQAIPVRNPLNRSRARIRLDFRIPRYL